MTLVLIGLGAGGCALSRGDSFARLEDQDVTGSLGAPHVKASAPTDSDLAFARNAASDVLTKGDKDSSQAWENPETGARGSVTPLAQAYTAQVAPAEWALYACQLGRYDEGIAILTDLLKRHKLALPPPLKTTRRCETGSWTTPSNRMIDEARDLDRGTATCPTALPTAARSPGCG